MRSILAVLAAALAWTAAGCGGGAGPTPAGARLAPWPLPAAAAVEPGRRSVTLCAFTIEPLAARVEVVSLRATLAASSESALWLRRLRLAADRDADGRFDPLADLVIAPFEHVAGNGFADAPAHRTLEAGIPETWLVIGDFVSASAGARLRVSVGRTGVVLRTVGGATLGVEAEAAIDGPDLEVASPLLASGMLLAAGGSRAALRVPTGLLSTAVRIAGNPATGLRAEGPGVCSFMLPRSVPGVAAVVALGFGGTVLPGFPAAVQIARGTGPARFVDVSLDLLPRDDAFSQDAEVADVNGDGAPDLLIPCYAGEQDRLYLNDGEGRFHDVTEEPGRMPSDSDFSEDLVAGDIDGDGDLDFVVANGGAQVDRLSLNDGTGTFTDAPASVFHAALGGGAHVVFGDFDGDGDPDLLGAHFWGNNHLYRNDAGQLLEADGMLPTSPGGFAGAVFVDLDQDADLDLVLAAFWGGNRVLRNPR